MAQASRASKNLIYKKLGKKMTPKKMSKRMGKMDKEDKGEMC